jgi:hypothetical protein
MLQPRSSAALAMALDISYRVGAYNVDTALRLLGPADFGDSEPQNCLDYLILLVKHIGLCILRTLNFVCGDHQWYNNRTACQIVQGYFARGNTHSFQNEPLRQRVQQLYDELEFRANGSLSYTEGMERGLLPGNVQRSTVLPLMEDEATQEIDVRTSDDNPAREISLDGVAFPVIFDVFPPEIRFEIFKKLDEQSLLNLLSTESYSYHSMRQDPIFYKNLLIELALKKMLRLSNLMHDGRLYSHSDAMFEIAQVQALTEPQSLNERLLQELASTNQMANSPERAYMNKASKLFYIIKTQALVNPDEALVNSRFLANHSAFTKDILSIIVKVQALTDFQQAIATYSLIDDDWIAAGVRCVLSEVQDLISPQQAIATADSIDEGWLGDFVNTLSIKAQASANPEQALDRINRLGSDSYKVKALCEIAKRQAGTNHEFANRLFQQAIDLANHQPYEEKINLFCLIAKAQAVTNPEQANQLFQQAIDIISQRPYDSRDPLPDNLYYMIAEAQALSHTAQALKTINDHLSIRNLEFLKLSALCSVGKARLLRTMRHDNPLFQNALDEAHSIEDWRHRCAAHETITNTRSPLTKRACQIFDQAIEISNHFDRNGKRIASYTISKAEVSALCEVAKEEALTNPERANAFFLQALHLASVNDLSNSYRIKLLAEIARMIAETRFDATLDINQ